MGKSKEKKSGFVLIMILYLAGLFMGALDTGIVTPARTVIQNSLGVDATSGVWMITIYTLFYAASIPIMGKLADMFGRKYIYIVSISLFGIGSLFCGLSSQFDSFALLIAARAVQAIGGGGIMPVATAEFGTSFPPEKRGMALGLVGGVYGIANVFGASVGSAIMDIFGTDCWSYIFYINVPISVFIVVVGLVKLKNNKVENTKRMDYLGIFVLTAMILSLLYGLKSLDFFDFANSIAQPSVFVYLLIFVALLPIFILIERKAEDPVINLHYFSDRNIVIALAISFASGFVMMGMIFVPQFSENALHMATGSGGYLVIILGLFAGASSPVSGRLVDRFGAKRVLGLGFIISLIGSLFLVFVTTNFPNLLTVIIGLVFVGLGMGFTMGTPLNYIMLANTEEREANSALAAMSLIRSIGTAVAPAIMIGFIAHAGMAVQSEVMTVLPQEINMPALAYSEEVSNTLDEFQSDPQMAPMLGAMGDLPDMNSMTSMNLNMADMSDGDYEMPADVLELLQNSDVTNITDNVKILVDRMFGDMMPSIQEKIEGGINEGIDGLQAALDAMPGGTAEGEMPGGMGAMAGMGMTGGEMPAGMGAGMPGMQGTVAKLEALKEQMTAMRDSVPGALEQARDDYLQQIDDQKDAVEKVYQDTLNDGFQNVYRTSAIAALAAILLLLFYSSKREAEILEEKKRQALSDI